MSDELNRKVVASFLDDAAARAEMIDADPASQKQCWYLAGLIVDADDIGMYEDIVLNTSFMLTKREASGLIEMYVSQKGRPQSVDLRETYQSGRQPA